jgi:drug/metabolite transporter (DMT)-like permease
MLQPLLVAFLWALYPFLLKQIDHVDHIVQWTYMTIIAAICAIILCIVQKKNLILKKKDLTLLLVASILGPVFGMLLYCYVIANTKEISITNALTYTSPLFAAIIGYFIFKERLSIKQYMGILGIFIGILLIVL